MAKRSDMQWQRVAQYTPMYMGVCEAPESPVFVEDANDPIRDGQGYDCDGNTAGYWRVWSSFVAFKRDYPTAVFYENGWIAA